MKRFLTFAAAAAALIGLSSVSVDAASYAAPAGRLLSNPHEMTIAIRAKSNGAWSGALLNQMGASNCGFSLEIARMGGGGGGWGRPQRPQQQPQQPQQPQPMVFRLNGAQNGAIGNLDAVPQNEWVNIVIAASQKENRMELFINGKSVAKTRPGSIIGNPTWRPLVIGADANGNNKFNGEIASVGLWDRALTPEEAAGLSFEGQNALQKANFAWDLAAGKTLAGGAPLHELRRVNVSSNVSAPAEPLTLWYRRVPNQWTDMLPIGNGLMGGMIAGKPEHEFMILNEGTIWAGGPYDHLNKGASADKLAEMRQAIFSGDANRASNIANSNFISRPSAEMSFTVAGVIELDQNTGDGDITDYIHSLDIRDSVAKTSFKRDGVTYTREYIASYPDKVIAVRLTADKPGSINLGTFLGTPHDYSNVKVSGRDISLTAKTIENQGIPGATNFEIHSRVFNKGGKLSDAGRGIRVENANSVVVVLTIASSFVNCNDVSADPAKRVAAVMDKFSSGVDFEALKAKHTADYRKLFDRVSLDLGASHSNLPTDQRLAERSQPGSKLDPDLAVLYFQFGRYLLISSSRPGGQPANLQGIWSEEVSVPWQSKYTININTEMNYWPAESTNLSECHEPLFQLISSMVPNGKKAAQKLYGVNNGWVAHHNTDLWRQCGPIDFSPTGMWPMGGAWLCLHYWDHYQFTRSTDDLRKYYPVMKESVKFYLDFLQVDEKHGGALVTIPSYSPEQGGLCASPTMDVGILTALFRATIESSKILNDDPAFRTKMEAAMKKFPPFTIGSWGQLREWMDDNPVDNPTNTHRHVSHLFAVFPGNVIRASDTALFNAAKVSLDHRGDDATGWSMGWKINLWARLLDGDRAWRLVGNLIHPSRTYNNLFDAHPPFQIDGNFGGTAGIIEMLLQSQETTADGKIIVDLLPALPSALPRGTVSGIKARGNAEVVIVWNDGALSKAKLSGLSGLPVIARYHGKTVDLSGKKGSVELTSADFR